MALQEAPPFIKIGNGTIKFYTNLCKAYLKNHNEISVLGGGYKINIALNVYLALKKEYCVYNLQHVCLFYNRMHSMCIFSVKKGNVNGEFEIDNFDNDISIDNEDSISSLTNRCVQLLRQKNSIVILAKDSCAVKAFFLASQLTQRGFLTYTYPLKMLQNDSFLIKIKVYKSFFY